MSKTSRFQNTNQNLLRIDERWNVMRDATLISVLGLKLYYQWYIVNLFYFILLLYKYFIILLHDHLKNEETVIYFENLFIINKKPFNWCKQNVKQFYGIFQSRICFQSLKSWMNPLINQSTLRNLAFFQWFWETRTDFKVYLNKDHPNCTESTCFLKNIFVFTI